MIDDTDNSKLDPQEAAIPRERFPAMESPDGVVSIYANVSILNWTMTDVRIRFGELIQIVAEDIAEPWGARRPIVEERVGVTIPWTQAKYLRNQLDELINSYELLNPEIVSIKIPPGS